MNTLIGGTDLTATPAQPCVTIRIALFALALGILGACAAVSDAEFTRSFCESRGHEASSARFEQCVTNKQKKMEHERAIRDSFRYSPKSSISIP